jgi:WD40 repeat protein
MSKVPRAFLEPRWSVDFEDYVVDVSWSSDGRGIAVAGGEGRVAVVADPAGKPTMRELGEHTMGALAVAWQPGGATVASSGQDSALAFWEADSGTEIRRVRPGTAWTEHLAWSPDGKRLAVATGKALSLWDAAGERVLDLAATDSTIAAIAWDKPGRDLAAAMNGGVVVYRATQQPPTARRYPWGAACLTAAFSPNGKLLASGVQDGSVHFWYLASGKDSQMRGYGSKVQLTAWSANSRYLATSAGPEIIVWDFGGKGPEGTRPQQMNGHTERIEAMAFHPTQGWLATGGRDWRLSLWLPGKAEIAIDAHLTDSEVTTLRWSPDGRLLAVGERKGGLAAYELVTV